MPEGLITKALAGYYYVTPLGELKSSEVQCRARGVFKKRGVTPLVGDRVVYEMTDNGEGTVTEVHERSSELIRPPAANIDAAVLVFSVVEPDLSLQLLDKFLVHTEAAGLDAVIVVTKTDMIHSANEEGPSDAMETLQQMIQLYERIGYETFVTSSKFGEGVEALKRRLDGRISVLAGQSGVGKSSLLNAMIPGLQLETNAISFRLGRGKHTTRHVELMPLANGWIADTPGFSQLDFLHIEAEELSSCFREFREPSGSCKFRGCTHQHEPECRVIELVERGDIARSRHEHYLEFLQEMKDRKRRY